MSGSCNRRAAGILPPGGCIAGSKINAWRPLFVQLPTKTGKPLKLLKLNGLAAGSPAPQAIWLTNG